MTQHYRLLDANYSRLGEALRVLEDICRFELCNEALVTAVKSMRNQLKDAYALVPYAELINSRSTGTDVRANSTIVSRTHLPDLVTANVKRATEACRSLEEATGQQLFSTIRYAVYNFEKDIWHHLKRMPLAGPGIYVVSDNPEHLVNMAQKPYVPVVQYRAKDKSKAEIYNACKPLAKEIAKTDTLFMVNDFVDIAIAVNSDGLHVGQDDIAIPLIRQLLGHTKLIGRTTHSIDQGLTAQQDGADYISVGPIWDTPSKPGRPGIGFDYLKKASTLSIPYVTIGGINLNNIDQILPHKPPLIGAIRSTNNIGNLWKKIKNSLK